MDKQICGKGGNTLIIGMGNTFETSSISHEMVGHLSRLPNRFSELQVAEGTSLLISRSFFLVSKTKERDVHKYGCPKREKMKRNLSIVVIRTIWCFLAYVFYVVLSMPYTMKMILSTTTKTPRM